ncbi:MAG TPA: 3-oxoacyl-[acyl-carrier-protein] synthase III C-terminal domain-containing protein [Bryobacteraceae bacterium]|nr:3-oxoacyl-[acyl-carrier-protein] synthase III C-terminal domain-containing protein [Bryobacteraceae bacterium]
MKIASTGTALPRHYYPQEVLIDAFRQHWGNKLERFAVLEHIHTATRVDGRYLVLPIESYPGLKRWGDANNIWLDAALELGQEAICKALDHGGIERQKVAALFFVSITGISSPSVDARLVNRMGLNRNIKRIPIFGLGCVAGAAGIARAADYVKAFPDEVAVLLSVELCSLTLQQDDLSVANLISVGLFGDGAAAVVLAGSNVANGASPEIVATRSIFYPNTEEVMGWDVSEKGFRIVLSRDVPVVVQDNLRRDADCFLADHGLSRRDIGSWVIHTGGPRVLEAATEALELPDGAIQASWDCLRKTGNLSSASVLFVLDEVMKNRRPTPGTWGLLAAMGPGFCSELLLLKW